MPNVRFSMPIVGAKYHKGAVEALAALGDDATLILAREPHNRFDSKAVSVWHGKQQLGYVTADQAKKVAAIMDARNQMSVEARFDKSDGRPSFATITFVGVGG